MRRIAGDPVFRQIARVRPILTTLVALALQLPLVATAAACTGGGPWPNL